MRTKGRKQGISLIVLIVTIIVIIILAAVVILTLSKNNPIESAKEARFKEDVRTFQDELALAVSKEYANAGGHRDTKISTSDFDKIKEYIPSFSEKYRDKFIIQDDELKYTNKLDDNEKEYAQSINVREKNKLLPDEYQQVEYIESSGTQIIDTKYIPTENTSMNIEFIPLETIGSAFIGVVEVDMSRCYRLFNYSNRIYFDFNGRLYGNSMPPNSKVNIGLYNYYVIKNGEKVLSGNTINKVSLTNSVYVFGDNEVNLNRTKYSKMKLFSLKIYSDNVSEKIFIPCYSTTTVTDIDGKQCSAGTAGLYDTVEGKFYTNQGTGEFIPGPEV